MKHHKISRGDNKWGTTPNNSFCFKFLEKWMFKEKLNTELSSKAFDNLSITDQELILKTLEHSNIKYNRMINEGNGAYIPQAHDYILKGKYKEFLDAVNRDIWAEREHQKTLKLRDIK